MLWNIWKLVKLTKKQLILIQKTNKNNDNIMIFDERLTNIMTIVSLLKHKIEWLSFQKLEIHRKEPFQFLLLFLFNVKVQRKYILKLSPVPANKL